MRHLRSLLTGALFLFVLAGCHRNAPEATASLPPLLIDDRGVVLPLDEAVTKIAYRPWIPPGVQVLKYAVIPPLGSNDTPQNRGLAVEFEQSNVAWLLSEWPKQNFALLLLKGQDISLTPCVIAHYKLDGVAWTTHGKLAMTLQPDGSVPVKSVEAEARRLIAAGACK